MASSARGGGCAARVWRPGAVVQAAQEHEGRRRLSACVASAARAYVLGGPEGLGFACGAPWGALRMRLRAWRARGVVPADSIRHCLGSQSSEGRLLGKRRGIRLWCNKLLLGEGLCVGSPVFCSPTLGRRPAGAAPTA